MLRIIECFFSTNIEDHPPIFWGSSISSTYFEVWVFRVGTLRAGNRKYYTIRLCKACRSAAVKISPEIVRGSRHGQCREISGEMLLFLFPQETKRESVQNFSQQISRRFSLDALQLQMHTFMAFFHSADVCPWYLVGNPHLFAKCLFKSLVPLNPPSQPAKWWTSSWTWPGLNLRSTTLFILYFTVFRENGWFKLKIYLV